MNFPSLTIKAKLTLVSISASVLSLAILCLGIFFYQLRVSVKESQDYIARQSSQIVKDLGLAVAERDINFLQKNSAVFKNYRDFISLDIYDSNHNLIFSATSNTGHSINNAEKEIQENQRVFSAKNHFDVVTRIVHNNQKVGSLTLRFSYASIHRNLTDFAIVLLLGLFLMILVSSLFTLQVQGVLTNRLFNILNLIRRISASKNYSLVIDDKGDDEIAVLARDFNQILEEINHRDLSLTMANCSLEGKVQERTIELESALQNVREAQWAASAKHKQLLSLIAYAPAAMAMLDNDLNYIVCSAKWISDFELDKSILLRKDSKLDHRIPEAWNSAFSAALNGQTTSNSEDFYFKEDGSKVALRWTIQPWGNENNDDVQGMIIASEDISDLVRARDEALQSAQTKAKFLANVSHELRTPLNGIIGFSTILRESECTPEQQEYIDLIKSSGEMLLHLINDVLDYSKLEKRATQIECLSFSPRILLNEVAKLFAADLNAKDIELSVEVDPKIPSRLMGDDFRLKQILTNLVSNAVKFTSDGWVKIRLDCEERGENNYKLTFSVEDSGIGIHSDKLELIFKPFSQADGTMTRRFGGTGLGLSIASELVRLMGGQFDVYSKVGAGSKFSFAIELKVDEDFQARKHIEQTTEIAVPETTLKRVLVAEDNSINQKLIQKILEKAGYNVALADDGAQAVSYFKNGHFDLVILDLQMPVMSGIEAAAQIRKLKNSTGKSIPILALTAHAFEDDRQKCEQAGMNGFLTKPIDRHLLLETISQLEEDRKLGS